MASVFRDWAELPPELLNLIATKLDQLSDYMRFCGVCPQWRLVAIRSDNDHNQSLVLLRSSHKKLPMLMIKTQEHNNDMRGLYNVSDGITYKIKLPQPRKDRFFGSSHGWLMYFEENNSITLLNPLTNSCISLPVFEHELCQTWDPCLRDYFFVKGILSHDPCVNPNNYIVAVIYSGMNYLAVYKAGEMHWQFIYIHPYHQSYNLNSLGDVNFYKGNLYGVTFFGKLVQIDICSSSEKTIIDGHDSNGYARKYLVESHGELLMVQRLILMEDKGDDYEIHKMFNPSICCSRATTTDFQVFKLVHGKDFANWVQTNNIGMQALFLGSNHSLSVSTLEFPQCLSNSIYFNSQLYLYVPLYECGGIDEDSGVFKLEDRSFHSHHLLDSFEWHVEPPMWVVPNLN